MIELVGRLGIPGHVDFHPLSDGMLALVCLLLGAGVATVAQFSHAARTVRSDRAALTFAGLLVASSILCLVGLATTGWISPTATSTLRIASAIAAAVAALVLPVLLPRAMFLVRLARNREESLAAAQRDLHAAVAKAEGLETQVFANVSHELRTPLSLILGPSERLLAGTGLSQGQRADIEVIARNARSLLRHVNDLLNVAKGEAGKLKATYSEVDVAELVRTTSAHFDGFAADRNIDYAVEVTGAILVEVDGSKLQRAVLNLLSNAFKFTPAGGRVRCTARRTHDQHVAIEIADSGPGIPRSERGAVFERFHQVARGATGRFGGTGLGLSIVKDFIEVQRGTVSIADAPEGGALLRIELPVEAPKGTVVSKVEDSAVMVRAMVREALDSLREPSDPSPLSAPSDQPLILVVEDNADMNRFVATSLASSFRVVSALDGQRGLEYAIELRPDLIVSDVMMPGLSGDALVREVRSRPELDSVPIVLLTAKADDELRMRLLREGAQDFLAKPFFAEELQARVRNLVTMKRARDILQRDLATRARDLESLAREVGRRRRELETALDSAKVARDHADRASAMKTSFLRMVSHELRTPLTSLKLNLDRLKRCRDEALSPRQDDMVRRIATSALRLHELIESLLEYARIEGGRLRVELEDFDVWAIARDVIEELSPQAEQKGIALKIAPLTCAAPLLRSDPRILRLVVVNLVGNAVKFTQQGGVDVTVAYEDGAHRIQVHDSGPGIPSEDHERIFEPFEQMEPVPNKHTRGVGLGLSIVKEIVEALKGRIELSSQVGSGSTFTVVLPPFSTESDAKA